MGWTPLLHVSEPFVFIWSWKFYFYRSGTKDLESDVCGNHWVQQWLYWVFVFYVYWQPKIWQSTKIVSLMILRQWNSTRSTGSPRTDTLSTRSTRGLMLFTAQCKVHQLSFRAATWARVRKLMSRIDHQCLINRKLLLLQRYIVSIVSNKDYITVLPSLVTMVWAELTAEQELPRKWIRKPLTEDIEWNMILFNYWNDVDEEFYRFRKYGRDPYQQNGSLNHSIILRKFSECNWLNFDNSFFFWTSVFSYQFRSIRLGWPTRTWF